MAPENEVAIEKDAKKKEAKELSKHEEYLEHDHGYNFEVPATAKVGLCEPIPLKEMGRFNHEAWRSIRRAESFIKPRPR